MIGLRLLSRLRGSIPSIELNFRWKLENLVLLERGYCDD
jgi:hypothetical protein